MFYIIAWCHWLPCIIIDMAMGNYSLVPVFGTILYAVRLGWCIVAKKMADKGHADRKFWYTMYRVDALLDLFHVMLILSIGAFADQIDTNGFIFIWAGVFGIGLSYDIPRLLWILGIILWRCSGRVPSHINLYGF